MTWWREGRDLSVPPMRSHMKALIICNWWITLLDCVCGAVCLFVPGGRTAIHRWSFGPSNESLKIGSRPILTYWSKWDNFVALFLGCLVFLRYILVILDGDIRVKIFFWYGVEHLGQRISHLPCIESPRKKTTTLKSRPKSKEEEQKWMRAVSEWTEGRYSPTSVRFLDIYKRKETAVSYSTCDVP